MWQKSQRHDFRRVEALHCSSSEEACIRVSSRSEVGWRRWHRSRSRWSPSRRGAPASSCPSPRCQSHPPSVRWARWTSCDEDMKLMQVNYKKLHLRHLFTLPSLWPLVDIFCAFPCQLIKNPTWPSQVCPSKPYQHNFRSPKIQDEGRDQVLQANWYYCSLNINPQEWSWIKHNDRLLSSLKIFWSLIPGQQINRPVETIALQQEGWYLLTASHKHST